MPQGAIWLFHHQWHTTDYEDHEKSNDREYLKQVPQLHVSTIYIFVSDNLEATY